MDVAVDQYGYVTAENAAAVGVIADRLRTMAKRGTLERVAYGLYRVPAVASTSLDNYMEAALWPRRRGAEPRYGARPARAVRRQPAQDPRQHAQGPSHHARYPGRVPATPPRSR
ncbi:hypothetical protein [Solirubrobacter soli]|uniref:hypothetical protein n=1 Tax=Solirubrobacter soli TaxID=363832 RepID=UPI00352E43BE